MQLSVPAKRVLVALAAVVALLLGVLQVTSTIALRRDAAPGAWVRLLPASAGEAVDHLDPALPLPFALRLVLARSALERGDERLAAAHAARLGPSRDRDALLGGLAEARGDATAAVRYALAAGDLPSLERSVDSEAAAGRGAAALRLQQETILRLSADRADEDALAEAYFHLGLLEQRIAYTLPIAARGPDQRASYVAYGRAVELAPLSARYLLGGASEALNVGDVAGAARLFERARVADPTNAAAIAGLGEVALRRGDPAEAARALARAQRIDAANPAVGRLARELRIR